MCPIPILYEHLTLRWQLQVTSELEKDVATDTQDLEKRVCQHQLCF